MAEPYELLVEKYLWYFVEPYAIREKSFFVGIVWWAWSPSRQPANQESAELPFDLPDEFSKDKS